MFFRSSLLPVVCLLATAISYAQPGTDYLFQLPGAESGNGRILTYLANDANLTPDVDLLNGPLNTRQVLTRPDGQGFYVIADGPLQYLNPDLQTFQTLNQVQGPISQAKFSPDGKYLWVFGAQVYTVRTSTNQVVATNLGVQADARDIAFSPDSSKAWLLQEFPAGGLITPIDLATLTVGEDGELERAGVSITRAPNGNLFVAAANQIREYNPVTFEMLSEALMTALPGPLHFTADGSRAYFVNRTPQIGGYYVLYLRTADHEVVGWRDVNNPPTFDDIMIADSNRIFGFERSKNKLWQLIVEDGSAQIVNFPGVLNGNNVFAATISREVPAARFLYVVDQGPNQPTIKRIDLATHLIQVESNALTTAGELFYVGVPPQSGAANIEKTNDNQQIPGGGPAKPISIIVTDAVGRPVFNQAVSFTSNNPNVAISTPNAITNVNGFAQTEIAVPLTPGAYNVTATADFITTEFTLIVPSEDGGGPGENPRISIVRGDGQLLLVGIETPSFSYPSLRVRVVDEEGNPQPGVAVNFRMTNGTGGIRPAQMETDQNGEAFTNFTARAVPHPLAFQINTVRAETEYGAVEFNEIVWYRDLFGIGEPKFTNLKTGQDFGPQEVTIGRGDLVPNFMEARITTPSVQALNSPIPKVTLRVADATDPTKDGPGRCVNDTRSTINGIARCDLQFSCDVQDSSFMIITIGEYRHVKYRLNVVAGTSQLLSYVSGNQQSGVSGQLLPNALTARITDNCGNAVVGKDVVWTVTQGSASLSQVISTSNSTGTVSARVTLGPVPGPVRVTVAMAGSDPVVFNLTNNVVISGVSLLSGSGQKVLPNQPFPNPVVFVVRDNFQNPVGAGFTVQFTLTGSATLNTLQAQTNAQGQVQASVTAGPLSGPVTVTATHAGFSATAQLTVDIPSLPIAPAAFTNTASGAEGMTPCGLVTVIGNGLAPNINGVLSGVSGFGPLPYILGGVQIKVNGIAAPIQAVANQGGVQQVNFQAPCQLTAGTATVEINVNGGITTVTGVKVFQYQPGIFSFRGPNNKLYGAVIRIKDGTYITPDNLAPTGESFYLILTGLGQTNPPALTNSAGSNQPVALQTIVGVDNGGMPSQQGRYLTGSVGVYYIEFTIPKTTNDPPGTILKRDVNLAGAVIIDGQFFFGNPTLLPGIVQGQ